MDGAKHYNKKIITIINIRVAFYFVRIMCLYLVGELTKKKKKQPSMMSQRATYILMRGGHPAAAWATSTLVFRDDGFMPSLCLCICLNIFAKSFCKNVSVLNIDEKKLTLRGSRTLLVTLTLETAGPVVQLEYHNFPADMIHTFSRQISANTDINPISACYR